MLWSRRQFNLSKCSQPEQLDGEKYSKLLNKTTEDKTSDINTENSVFKINQDITRSLLIVNNFLQKFLIKKQLLAMHVHARYCKTK